MARTAPGTTIPDDFGYAKHPELKEWIEKEFPQLDSEKTMTQFIEYAEDSGRIATLWPACFKRIVRAGIDNGWKGICAFKQGRAADPRWQAICALAKQYGFREPLEHESVGGYRTAFDQWKDAEKRSPVVLDFGAALKVMR